MPDHPDNLPNLLPSRARRAEAGRKTAELLADTTRAATEHDVIPAWLQTMPEDVASSLILLLLEHGYEHGESSRDSALSATGRPVTLW